MRRTLRAYMWPITANWTRLSGSQSTLAPTSSSSDGLPVTVGRMVASAGRWTPASMPRTILAVAMAAPVLPAVKKPAAVPSRTMRRPTRMEESRLARTAWAALSSMLIHSEEWTMSMSGAAVPGQRGARSARSRARAQNLFRADQVDADVVVAAREDSPANLGFGGLVGTHSIYDDVDRHQEGRARAAMASLLP